MGRRRAKCDHLAAEPRAAPKRNRSDSKSEVSGFESHRTHSAVCDGLLVDREFRFKIGLRAIEVRTGPDITPVVGGSCTWPDHTGTVSPSPRRL